MAVLTGSKIYEEVMNGNIKIDPFDPSRINPNSYNLRFCNTLKVYKRKYYKTLEMVNGFQEWVRKEEPLDSHSNNETEDIIIPETGFVLEPNELYLGRTIELTGTDMYVPKIDGRSSTGRLGMQVHLTAGFGDIGFHGTWTLEITVPRRLRVYPNDEICQVSFETVYGDTDYLYNGRYQNQVEVTASKFYEDKKGVFNASGTKD